MATTLSAVNVSKTFVGNTVLSDFEISLEAGEIVALIGQNGSGKSTFIKILSGFHEPDDGAQFSLGTRDISGSLGSRASETGMAFVHQDLPLIPSMSIIENLRITDFETGFGGRIRWKHESKVVSKYLDMVGLQVDPRARVGELSVTEQALVAIARSLSEIDTGENLDARLLVLDEPTAYLPNDGVERLFEVLRNLAAEGISILFVSHRLDEVIDHCRRAIVLRGGKKVGDISLEGKTERDLVELMLGQTPEDIYPEITQKFGEEVVRVSGLSGSQLADASFSARRGEVIGFVGLPGEGYDELPYLLVGAKTATGGVLSVDEKTTSLPKVSPGRAFELGVVLLPADRKGASGAVSISVGSNLSLPSLMQFTSWGVLRKVRERNAVQAELSSAEVHPPNPDAALATLSGGNQQKVLIRKWSYSGPKVYILHEPTQGVDVGAKRQVFAELARMSEAGATVIISSVEFEDLVNMCHRVHVVRKGAIDRTLEGDALTVRELALAVHER
jgi:ribose transport system ATP-binding protein